MLKKTAAAAAAVPQAPEYGISPYILSRQRAAWDAQQRATQLAADAQRILYTTRGCEALFRDMTAPKPQGRGDYAPPAQHKLSAAVSKRQTAAYNKVRRLLA